MTEKCELIIDKNRRQRAAIEAVFSDEVFEYIGFDSKITKTKGRVIGKDLLSLQLLQGIHNKLHFLMFLTFLFIFVSLLQTCSM